MREIKFRAWHKSYKKMLYEGFDLDPDGNVWCNQFNISDQIIIMQYTGLKDVLNNDIYEGDILYHEHLKLFKRVKWSDKEAGFNIKSCYYPYATKENRHSWKIIGNIYETPDLLKKGT